MVLAFDGEAPPGVLRVRDPGAAERRPVHPPGADRDLLPPAVGARARVLRARRAPERGRRPRRGELPLSRSSTTRRPTSTRCSPTSRASVVMKADEIGALREQTLTEGADTLRAAAEELRARLDAGGTLLALGNGGSATDAMDVVADFRAPPGRRGARPHRGPGDHHRARQRHRHRRDLLAPGDRLRRAGRRADRAVDERQLGQRDRGAGRGAQARAGDDRLRRLRRRPGGGGGLADHVIVTRSEHIPRIQEAQASAYHVLELVEPRER